VSPGTTMSVGLISKLPYSEGWQHRCSMSVPPTTTRRKSTSAMTLSTVGSTTCYFRTGNRHTSHQHARPQAGCHHDVFITIDSLSVTAINA